MTTIDEEDMYEMVSLRPASTGVPMNLWLRARGRKGGEPRLYVQTNRRPAFDYDNIATVSVEEPVRLLSGALVAADLHIVEVYIKLNRQAILDHWNEKTDSYQLVYALKRVSELWPD